MSGGDRLSRSLAQLKWKGSKSDGKGLQSKKHTGVISLFSKHFVKPGLVDKKFSKILTMARDERELSDYADFFEAEKEKTEEQIKDPERFINMTISFLQTRGFELTS